MQAETPMMTIGRQAQWKVLLIAAARAKGSALMDSLDFLSDIPVLTTAFVTSTMVL